MATWKDIKTANEEIRTMEIKRWDKKQNKEVSKDYAEVNQRIKAFRMVYPEGFITTDILSHEGGVVVMRAEAGVIDPDGKKIVLGSGMAFEDKKNGMINATSYIENCETSAVGRALGMCGFGIDMSVASYEEVKNAMAVQDQKSAEQPKKPAEPPKVYVCERCGDIVKDTAKAKAETIVKQSQKQFGKTFCMNCGREYKKEQDEAKAKEAEAKEAEDFPFPLD